jgi:hypothetical protein
MVIQQIHLLCFDKFVKNMSSNRGNFCFLFEIGNSMSKNILLLQQER